MSSKIFMPVEDGLGRWEACVTVDGDVVVFPRDSDNGIIFILDCNDILHVGIGHMAGTSQRLPYKDGVNSAIHCMYT